MKSYRKELWFRVPSRRGLVNITGEVEKALEESGVQEGLVLVNAMNITASVFINDDEPGRAFVPADGNGVYPVFLLPGMLGGDFNTAAGKGYPPGAPSPRCAGAEQKEAASLSKPGYLEIRCGEAHAGGSR